MLQGQRKHATHSNLPGSSQAHKFIHEGEFFDFNLCLAKRHVEANYLGAHLQDRNDSVLLQPFQVVAHS